MAGALPVNWHQVAVMDLQRVWHVYDNDGASPSAKPQTHTMSFTDTTLVRTQANPLFSTCYSFLSREEGGGKTVRSLTTVVIVKTISGEVCAGGFRISNQLS